MKIMVVAPGPSFSVADVCRGWSRAFRELGCEVVDVNLDDRLTYFDKAERALDARDESERLLAAVRFASQTVKADVLDYSPDVVFVVSGFYLPFDWLDSVQRHATLALLNTESPYEDDRQLLRSEHVDVVLLNDPTNLERFQAVNPRSAYYPHAYDPTVHHPGPVEDDAHRSDFVFIGTGYPSRREFFEQIDWAGIDAAFGGNWQNLPDDSPLAKMLVSEKQFCVDNDDTVKLYRATKMSANLYRKEATFNSLGWAMGPREVELAAVGTFFSREPRGEGDEILRMLPTFTEPGELEEQIRFYIDRPDDRERLAAQAREAVAARTFVANARRFLASL